MTIYNNHAVSGKRQFRIASILALIFAVAIVGSGAMYVLPGSRSMTQDFIYSIVIIALGLAIPYWMLKLSLHAAHIWNPREKEMHFGDLTKDKEQLEYAKEHTGR